MLTDENLEEYLRIFEKRMQDANDFYLYVLGEHVKDIGTLTPSDIHRVEQMKKAGVNIDTIKNYLTSQTFLNNNDVDRIFKEIAETDYSFASKFFNGVNKISFADNEALQRIIKAQSKITKEALQNLSNTTAISQAYKDVINKVVTASSQGVGSSTSSIRHILAEMKRKECFAQTAKQGLVVEYESGTKRRLESAARMNVLEGIRRTNAEVNKEVGREFGADGVEISCHGNCSPDHIDIQGRMFSLGGDKIVNGVRYKDFDVINNNLERPIGTLNCQHFETPVILGISEPSYSEKELDEIKRFSLEEIEIDGQVHTRYEWSQKQRVLENSIREQKHIANLSKASGDDSLRRSTQSNINELKKTYESLCEKAGLDRHLERAAVSGFKNVKPLQNAAGCDIILTTKNEKFGKANSITQRIGKKGGIDRNYYDVNGKQYKQVCNNNHGNPKMHDYGEKGEHAHEYIWDNETLIDRITRELTEAERFENSDIL